MDAEERNIWDVIEDNRAVLASFLLGSLLVGAFVLVSDYLSRPQDSEVKIISEESDGEVLSQETIVVEVGGAVKEPGVFEFPQGTRAGTAIDFAQGLDDQVDKEWVARNLNLAAPLIDGQKIYLPFEGENLDQVLGASLLGNSNQININTASESQLRSLEGIGEVRAQKIIGSRPYGSVEDLLTKDIIPRSVFEKVQDQISVF